MKEFAFKQQIHRHLCIKLTVSSLELKTYHIGVIVQRDRSRNVNKTPMSVICLKSKKNGKKVLLTQLLVCRNVTFSSGIKP